MSIQDRLTAALADRYAIERELGQGGMATVYLAEDLKHDRKVAVKVLKPELAAVVGGERFISEIRTTANLQHPHILPLFDSGEADSFLFYVMPYVEGETLRGKLDREKQLSVPEAVAITVKIAGALQSAHDQGIIHRDIKPGNILLQNGEPVVADFGIALAVRQAGEGRITETGLSLGTPYYMAPEQATGDRDPDQRSDLYSLACMLYEMLTGDPPFQGSTAQAVLGRILTEPAPAVTRARPSVPPNVEAALGRALQKLPADRFESVAEFSRALQNEGYVDPAARASGAWASAHAGGPAWKRALPWGFAAALAVVATYLAVTRDVGGTSYSGPSLRTTVDVSDLPPNSSQDGMVISHDGSQLAWPTPDGIWVRGAGEARFRLLEGTGYGFSMDFSPDAQSIVFGDSRTIRTVAVSGGSPRPIGASGLVRKSDVDWGADGRITVAGADSVGWGLFRVSETGQDPELLVRAPEGMLSLLKPAALPRGVGTLAVANRGADLPPDVVLHVEGEDTVRTLIQNALDATYLDPGFLLYATPDGDLLAQRFNLQTRSLVGPARPLLSGMQQSFFNGSRAPYSVSRNGTLVVETGSRPPRRPNWDQILVDVDLDGNETVLGLEPRPISGAPGPLWSPDGRTVAWTGPAPDEPDGPSRLWVYDTEIGGRPIAIASPAYYHIWSPDGSRLAFTNERGGPSAGALLVVLADGSAPPASVWNATTSFRPTDWPTDSEVIVEGGAGPGILRVTLTGDTTRYLATEVYISDARVSPNGQWIAYTIRGADGPSVEVRPFPRVGAPTRISSEGIGLVPQWSPDGQTLYYRGDQGLMSAELEFDPNPRVTERRTVLSGILAELNLHPSGDHFVGAGPADLGSVLRGDEGEGDEDEGETEVVVIHNLFAELERLFADEEGR